jgi:peroxiredoxin
MTAFRARSKWPTMALAAIVVGALGILAFQRPMAPDVTFTTLSGKQITMQELRGKVVWINFWATSCPACIEEMPDLDRTYRKFRDRGFEVLAVAMSYDPPGYVINYRSAVNLPFPVVLDTQGEIARAFGNISLTPTAVLVDKTGVTLKTIVGIPDFEEIHVLLDQQLSNQTWPKPAATDPF